MRRWAALGPAAVLFTGCAVRSAMEYDGPVVQFAVSAAGSAPMVLLLCAAAAIAALTAPYVGERWGGRAQAGVVVGALGVTGLLVIGLYAGLGAVTNLRVAWSSDVLAVERPGVETLTVPYTELSALRFENRYVWLSMLPPAPADWKTLVVERRDAAAPVLVLPWGAVPTAARDALLDRVGAAGVPVLEAPPRVLF